MNWKNKLNECCADEVEELIINSIKAGFLSNEEIEEECKFYIEEDYPDDMENIADIDFYTVITTLREEFQNPKKQENFLKLDLAFNNMEKRGIVTEHCAGYTLSDGIDDCNEDAAKYMKEGKTIIGYCFYTMQDLEHLFDGSTTLYFCFGNYSGKVTAIEVGQMIVNELEKVGFSTKWEGLADKRVAVLDMVWDKQYQDSSIFL